jgi:site-specific recombinase XerD
MNSFFEDNASLQPLMEGPLAPYLGLYAQKLRSQGYAKQTGRGKLQRVAGFSQWLHRKQVAAHQVTTKHASDFLRSCRSTHSQVRRGDPAALAGFLQLLRDHKVIPAPAPLPVPTASQRWLKEYELYLEKEQSLSLATRTNYLPFVRQFLQDRFGCGPVHRSLLQAADVLRFVRRAAAQLKGKRVLLMTTALRSFLRFARYRGEIALDLAACVPPVANWALSNLPKSLTPVQVRKVLAQARQRSSAVGRRDYAILLLLARLGLRGGEVAGLSLGDVDWEQSRISIRGKGDRVAQLPLPAEVGQALAAYLKDRRPAVTNPRRLFLRVRAPLVELKGSVAIATVVRRALERAKIQSPRKGAHLFRHALASAMLQNGSSLSEIGELLRHRSPDTTAIYAKVDLRALRSLALPWPGRIR